MQSIFRAKRASHQPGERTKALSVEFVPRDVRSYVHVLFVFVLSASCSAAQYVRYCEVTLFWAQQCYSDFHNKMLPARVSPRPARPRTRDLIIVYFLPVFTRKRGYPARCRTLPESIGPTILDISFTL